MKNEILQSQNKANEKQENLEESIFNVQRNKRKIPVNLNSVSEMVYIYNDNQNNANNQANDKNLNAVSDENDLTQQESKKMSILAMRGMALVGDTSFIPIGNIHATEKDKDKNSGHKTFLDRRNEVIDNHNNQNIERHELVNTKELYNKLDEIIDLNSQKDPNIKMKTLKKNFEQELNELKELNSNNKKYKR